jgi:hypothetical protein
MDSLIQHVPRWVPDVTLNPRSLWGFTVCKYCGCWYGLSTTTHVSPQQLKYIKDAAHDESCGGV